MKPGILATRARSHEEIVSGRVPYGRAIVLKFREFGVFDRRKDVLNRVILVFIRKVPCDYLPIRAASCLVDVFQNRHDKLVLTH
jgi:hypothetical protein